MMVRCFVPFAHFKMWALVGRALLLLPLMTSFVEGAKEFTNCYTPFSKSLSNAHSTYTLSLGADLQGNIAVYV